MPVTKRTAEFELSLHAKEGPFGSVFYIPQYVVDQRLKPFLEKHEHSVRADEGMTSYFHYRFVPSGVGVSAQVTCTCCNESCDVTDDIDAG